MGISRLGLGCTWVIVDKLVPSKWLLLYFYMRFRSPVGSCSNEIVSIGSFRRVRVRVGPSRGEGSGGKRRGVPQRKRAYCSSGRLVPLYSIRREGKGRGSVCMLMTGYAHRHQHQHQERRVPVAEANGNSRTTTSAEYLAATGFDGIVVCRLSFVL